MGWVALYVGFGVLGLLDVLIPTLRLWRAVRELGREVGRVSDSLSVASLELETAARDLPRAIL